MEYSDSETLETIGNNEYAKRAKVGEWEKINPDDFLNVNKTWRSKAPAV